MSVPESRYRIVHNVHGLMETEAKKRDAFDTARRIVARDADVDHVVIDDSMARVGSVCSWRATADGIAAIGKRIY